MKFFLDIFKLHRVSLKIYKGNMFFLLIILPARTFLLTFNFIL